MDARRWFKTKHLRRGFALFGNVSVNSIQAGSRKAGPPATLIASLQIRSWPKDASFADKSTAYRKGRSEEHTSELQSLMRISYAVFCLKTKKTIPKHYTK